MTPDGILSASKMETSQWRYQFLDYQLTALAISENGDPQELYEFGEVRLAVWTSQRGVVKVASPTLSIAWIDVRLEVQGQISALKYPEFLVKALWCAWRALALTRSGQGPGQAYQFLFYMLQERLAQQLDSYQPMPQQQDHITIPQVISLEFYYSEVLTYLLGAPVLVCHDEDGTVKHRSDGGNIWSLCETENMIWDHERYCLQFRITNPVGKGNILSKEIPTDQIDDLQQFGISYERGSLRGWALLNGFTMDDIQSSPAQDYTSLVGLV
jgi:hypothetical protein